MNKKRLDPVSILIYSFVGFGLLYLIAHFGYAVDANYRDASGSINIISVLNAFQNNITKPNLLIDTIFNTKSFTFRFAMFGIITVALWVVYKLTVVKKYRKGVEHGSARWGTASEAKKLMDNKNKNNNIILTNNVFMSLNTRQTRKNLNILVIGGSGAGKTRFFVKPNIMQMNTSYVITDPKGELLRSTGKMFEKSGYNVKVFNLVNMAHSFNYNPFAYVYNPDGSLNESYVIKLVNVLLKNTKKDGQGGGDQFWEDSTEALLLALSFYLIYEGNENEKNFATVMDLLQLAEVKEDEENFKSPLDFMFEDLEVQNQYHTAIKYYKIFKKAAGKTAKSILISAGVRLKLFLDKNVINLTHKDSIDIRSIGEKKTVLYVVISDSDDTFNPLAAILYTQIFDVLFSIADTIYKGRLPIHVRCLLDEFANIGTIPRFDKLVATMRSREISVNPIIQNMAQLKTMYKDSWESIVGNCDSLLFLGGKEQTSLDYVSKALGKETIDTLNRNVSKGYKNTSTSQNEGILGRDLMTADEVGKMPDSDCILLIRGVPPFYSRKFDLTKHKNYSFLDDFDVKNTFDYTQQILTAVMPKPDNTDDSTLMTDNEIIIKKIISGPDSNADIGSTSTVEIPHDEEAFEDDLIIVEKNGGEVLSNSKVDNDNVYIIRDLEIKDTDTYSDLNFDDNFVLNATDNYVVDPYEE